MIIDNSAGIFTVCNLGYLNKALVLAQSVYKTNNLKTNIFLFDKKTSININNDYVKIRWIEDYAPDNFLHLAFIYNVIELTTAFKPYLASIMAKEYSRVIFFDPDVMVFDKLDVVFDNLKNNDFILTPHQSNIEYDSSINLNYQRFGYFNLGFFAFNRSSISNKILDWWWKQCEIHCFDEAHYGSFTDQKWMSLAPFYFPVIKNLNKPQLNVAWLNLKDRLISKNPKTNKFTIDKQNIVFFHFSSFIDEKKLTKRSFEIGMNSNQILMELASLYQDSLLENQISLKSKTYSYDYFDNGDYINPILRRAYASKLNYFKDVIINPFSKPIKLTKFMNLNFLNSRSKINMSLIGHQDKKTYSKSINFYFTLLRLILRFLGPNKFIALNRLMIYSTSFLNGKEYWKLK